MEHVLVVIPAYNAAEFIQDTLEGIRDQRGEFTVHIVVCDDASADDSRRKVEIYRQDHRDMDIHLVCLPENSGAAAVPRNRAINYALKKPIPFEYIALCDADDVWLPHKLQGQLALFAKDHRLGLAYSRGIIIRKDDDETPVRRRLVTGFWKFMLFFHITASSVVLRRRAVEAFIPLFNEDPRLKVGEDSECWARLICRGVKVAATDRADLVYRVHPNAQTHLTNKEIRAAQRNLYRAIAENTGKSAYLLCICTQLKLLRYSPVGEIGMRMKDCLFDTPRRAAGRK